jgi:hypothetical protein
MAEWMIAHGSDVHQGGDGPLMRAALNAYRIPMMELGHLRTSADIESQGCVCRISPYSNRFGLPGGTGESAARAGVLESGLLTREKSRHHG